MKFTLIVAALTACAANQHQLDAKFTNLPDDLSTDLEQMASAHANKLTATTENMGEKGYEKALNGSIKHNLKENLKKMEDHPVVPGFVNIAEVNSNTLKSYKPLERYISDKDQ